MKIKITEKQRLSLEHMQRHIYYIADIFESLTGNQSVSMLGVEMNINDVKKLKHKVNCWLDLDEITDINDYMGIKQVVKYIDNLSEQIKTKMNVG